MPDRNTPNERDKFDHSSHPPARQSPGDLRAPGAGTAAIGGDGDGGHQVGRKTSRVRRLDSRTPGAK